MRHERAGRAGLPLGGALLIDPSVNGQSHILVNSGFVDIALALYGDVTVIARDSHVDALQAYIEASNLENVAFIKYKKGGVYKAYSDATRKNVFECEVFLNISYALFAKINIYAIWQRRATLYWVVHSHFLTFEHTGVFEAMKSKFKKSLMFSRLFNSTFVVCGERIKDNVDALVHRGDRVKAVFHPIGINRLAAQQSLSSHTPDTFSLLHIHGWHEASVNKIRAIQSIEHVTAQRKAIYFKDVKASIALDNNEAYFSRDYRDRLGAIAKYSYFLHLPENLYKLQASGALMDLLLTGTPVIGLRTDFGGELAAIIGEFGYFFDDYDSISDFLKRCDVAQVIADRERFSNNLATGYQKIKRLSLEQARQVLV